MENPLGSISQIEERKEDTVMRGENEKADTNPVKSQSVTAVVRIVVDEEGEAALDVAFKFLREAMDYWESVVGYHVHDSRILVAKADEKIQDDMVRYHIDCAIRYLLGETSGDE